MLRYDGKTKEAWEGMRYMPAFYRVGKLKVPVKILDVRFLFKTVQFMIAPYQDERATRFSKPILGAQWVVRDKMILCWDSEYCSIENILPEVFGPVEEESAS